MENVKSDMRSVRTLAGAGSIGGSEDEEQDDPTSSSSHICDLENFRAKWQQELKGPKKIEDGCVEYDLEAQARELFLRGVEMEKSGELYDAIKFYRRAVQIVPDIEFKLENNNKTAYRDNRDRQISDCSDGVHSDNNEDLSDDEEEDIKDGHLLPHIQRKMARSQVLFQARYDQKGLHVSSVPHEILLYILKWVVSSDLDVRSLELCAEVSRGFYLLSRDSEIWRLICRTSGVKYDKLPSHYDTWRDLYLDAPRLHFHGCYISKTTYIRHGENSFQDKYYRPVHLVAYYRYLRFFPDGRVLMLNSPDEPAQCVGLLRHRKPITSVSSINNTVRPAASVLYGNFLLQGDRVTIVVQHESSAMSNNNNGGGNGTGGTNRRYRRQDNSAFEVSPQTFHVELQVHPTRKRRHGQLVWQHYSVATHHRNGTDAHCTFDIVDMLKFPPLHFSRVKSYTQESIRPLA